MSECKHQFRIFSDASVKGMGVLTFYCQHCLVLRKIPKKYEGEP